MIAVLITIPTTLDDMKRCSSFDKSLPRFCGSSALVGEDLTTLHISLFKEYDNPA